MEWALGPMSNAEFWNVLFRELGWPDVWVNGEVCTDEMAQRAATALCELLRRGGVWK